MIRNPNYSSENFLSPIFDVSWPFYTVESDYLSAWACLFFAVILIVMAKYASRASKRLRVSTLFVCALVSLLVYSNFLTFHGPINKDEVRHLQSWDMFHYVIGTRYHAELGYDHFYDACLLALREVESDVSDRDFWSRISYRDMRNYEIMPATVALLQSEEIKAAFTEERWTRFVADIAVFYNDLGTEYFLRTLQDHGFNPPPTYTLVAKSFLGTGALTEPKLAFLASIDWVLLAAAFGLIAWGFGIEAALVSTILFGIAYMSNFSWVGNAFLRFGWFFGVVGGIVLQKKRYPIAAGLCLGFATGLRVFPGILLFSLAFPFLWSWWAEIRSNRGSENPKPAIPDWLIWKRSDRCMQLLKTTITAAVLLTTWAVLATLLSDRSSWSEWSETIALHNNRLSANHVGWRAAVTIDSDLTSGKIFQEDPITWWNEQKRETLAKRTWVYIPVALTFLGLLLASARRSSLAHYLVVGLTGLFFFIDLSGYYYSFLALLPLLFFGRKWAGLDLGYTSASCLALVIMGQYWTQQIYLHLDWVYTISSLVLALVLILIPAIHLSVKPTNPAEA